MKSTIQMVWHIFRKDAKLLWLFVLGAACIQFMLAGMLYMLDRFRLEGTLINLFNLLQVSSIAAPALLTATLVHQDAIPGVRQDWLVRPIRRRDLLLAKVLFLLLMVHGPMFLADAIPALLHGFSLIQSVLAAGSREIYLLAGLTLPILAFASLTRNMGEAVIGGVGAFVGFAAVQILINNHGQVGQLRGTGLFWIAESTMFGVALLGSGAILALQYFRRKTLTARWAMGVVAFLFLLGYMVPWSFAFALEERLSPERGAGKAISANFDPSSGRFRLPQGMSHTAVTENGPGRVGRDEASTVYLPLQVAGLSQEAVLYTDRAEVLLTGVDGNVIHRGAADDLVVRKDERTHPVHFTIGNRRSGFFRGIGPDDIPRPAVPSSDAAALVYQGIALPRNLYDHIKNQPLRLEINYSFTWLHGTTYMMPPMGGDLRIPDIGHCKTAMDEEGDDIRVRCLQAGGTAGCVSAFLEHMPSGRENPARFICWPSYSPYFAQYLPDAMSRMRASFPFRDLSGLAKYPVDASQIPESRLVIRVFRPQDHFTRQLVIPSIRLSDWESIERTEVAENR